MDFDHTNTVGSPKFCIAALLGTLVLSGCSSSEGYVDYTDIPGPKAVAVEDAGQEGSTPDTGEEKADTADTESGEQADGVVADATNDTALNDGTSDDTATQQQAGSSDAPSVNDGDPENPAAGQPPTVPLQEGSLDVVETESGTSDTPSEPREIKLLIPEKTFRTIPESECLSVTYDDIDLLKILNMEPVPANAPEHFPEWLKQLDGKRIRLRGFMFPAFVPTGIKTFGFARDNGICCFVKQPKVYDMIEVRMAEGKTTDYIDGRPFDVEGTFRIDPYVDDAELLELYRIEDAVVLN